MWVFRDDSDPAQPLPQGARGLEGEVECRMDVHADATVVGAQPCRNVHQRPLPADALLSLLPALLLKIFPPSTHSWSRCTHRNSRRRTHICDGFNGYVGFPISRICTPTFFLKDPRKFPNETQHTCTQLAIHEYLCICRETACILNMI